MPRAPCLLALAACVQPAAVGALGLSPRQADALLSDAEEGHGGADGLSPQFQDRACRVDLRGKTSLTLDLDGQTTINGDAPHDQGSPSALYIPIIRGQLGDSLRQLGYALLYGEEHNFTTVDVTHQAYTKHFAGFLNIPGDSARKDRWGKLHSIKMKPTTGYVSPAHCEICTTVFDPSDSRPAFSCPPVKSQKWAHVLKQYIKPLLTQDTRIDNRATSGELVIHMRSGDAMTSTDPLAAMEVQLPPCAFYDKIIEQGSKFQSDKLKVRIITQSDNLNPCIDEVVRRNPGQAITVQRGSLNEDAAAIMNAEHLVLAPSYFSFFMTLMNEKAKSIFYADSPDIAKIFPKGVVPCGDEGDPMVQLFTVPGLTDARSTLSERQNWMRSYSKHLITPKSTC